MKKRLISLLLALVMLLGLLPTGAFATETGVLPFAVEVDGEAATVTETADTVNCSWCYSEEPIYAVDIAGKQEMTLTFSGCAYAALLGPDTDWDPSNDLLEDYELTEGGTVTVSDLTEGNYLCVYDEETDYCYHLMFKDTSPKFTAAVDGEAMTQIEESVLSWVNWDGSAMSVPCYTVTVPQNTAEVTLTFKSEKQWSSYDSSGNYITGGAECWEAGIEHVVPVQDVDGDGEPDGISVQAPGAYSTEFYIQFVYGTASCLSVKSDAPATGEVAAGGLYQLKMSDVFSETAGHEVQYTYTFKDAAGNGGNVDYTFTKLQDGVLYLTPKTEGAHTLTFTATCSEGTVEHTVALTVGPPNEGIEQQYGYDETDKSSVTVYVTLSNNGMPLVAKDGTILANLEVTVPYFNLELYDLQAYNRYGTDGGRGPYVNSTVIQRPTGLHLYIYLLERYYMGLPEEECCRGTSGVLEYAESKDIEYMDGSVAYNSNGNRALVYSGGATSIFMNEFWGHDCNLMYYRNHCYPYMSPGWGSTSDYILLSDGDAIDVAMFSNWGFYHTGYFASFDRDVYEVAEGGGELTVYTRQWGTSAAAENFVPVNGSEGMSVTLYDSDWNELDWIAYEDEDSNAITVTVPEENGIYYLMAMDPSAGDEEEAKVAPAIARIVVGDQSAGGGDLSIYDECGFISLKDDQDRYLIDIEIGVLEGTEYGDLPTYQVIIEEGTETVYATFASGIEFGEWIATYDVAERTTDYSWDTISFEENEDGTVTVAIPVSNYTDTGTGIILEDSTNAWLYGFDFVIGEISEVQVGTAVSRILLNSYSEHLWIGDDVTLVPTVMPAEATGWTIQWTSSDETVATVDQNGKVTGTGDGAATITAAIGDVKVSCAVTVEAFNSAPSVVSGTLGWNKIKAGQTAQIDVSNWFTDAEQPVSALTYTAEIKKATAANFSQDYDYSTVAGPQLSVNGG